MAPKMTTWAYEFPEQILSALAQVEVGGWLTDPRSSANSLRPRFVAGMGGSGAAGRLAAAALAVLGVSIPSWVESDPTVPAWVGAQCSTGLLSYSGNTWETLTAFDEFQRRGLKPWIVTSGGELRRRGEDADCPIFLVPEGYAPRAALGWMLVPALIAILGDSGGVGTRTSILAELRAAANLLSSEMEAWKKGSFTEQRDPEALGRRLVGRISWIYAADASLGPVAYRWKTQIEENMKQLSLSGAFPEVAHNEIEGWNHGKDQAEPLVVVLGSATDSVEDGIVSSRSRGISAALAELASMGQKAVVLPPLDGSPLAQWLSQIQFADVTTLLGSAFAGVDPDPVDALTRVKNRISEA